MRINIANLSFYFALAFILVFQNGKCDRGKQTDATPPKATPASSTVPKTTSPEPAIPTTTVRTSLTEGVWGGQGIALTVTPSGTTDIEFDCAHGRIGKKVVPDSSGKFTVEGTYEKEGGPAKVGIVARDEHGTIRGDSSTASVARYAGRVQGENMIFTLTLGRATRPQATYNLTYGATPRLRKCL